MIYVFSLTSVLNGFCQINDNTWQSISSDVKDFYTVKNQYEAYIHQQYPDSIPIEKLGNIKNFYRMVNFWKRRIAFENDSTSFLPYIQSINNHEYMPVCGATDPANWELVGPSNLSMQANGLVSQVLYDPNTPDSYLLCADHGGIWKNQITGNTWRNVTDELKIPGLACTEMIRNPFDNNHIIVSTSSTLHHGDFPGYGQGLIESFNNGEDWSIITGFPNADYPAILKVIADPNDVNPVDGLTLFAIGIHKLYKSINTGLTWSIVNNLPALNQNTTYTDIEIANNGDVFLTRRSLFNDIDGQLFKYHNGTWADISSTLPDFQKMKLSKPYNGKIYATINNNKIYKTIDFGETWTEVHLTESIEKMSGEIAYSPTSEIIYIGCIKLHYFKDISETNTLYSFNTGHSDVRDIVFMGVDEQGDENILIANDGGISKVKINTHNMSQNLIVNLNGNFLPIEDCMGIGVSTKDSEFIVTGTVHNASFRYQNGIWTQFFPGVDGGDCEVNWDNPDTYYYQGNQTMKGGGSSSFSYSNNWFIGMEYELNPNNPYILYAGRPKEPDGFAKLLIYDEHGGSNGNGLLTIRMMPADISKVGAIGINNNNDIFVADWDGADPSTPKRFVKSVDNGIVWTDMSSKPVYKKEGSLWLLHSTLGNLIGWKAIEDIVFNPNNANEMWISIGGMVSGNQPGLMRVLHSTDGGDSWYDYSENLPPFPTLSLEYQLGSSNRLFAGTDAGVYYRDPTMSQWECFTKGLPICVISDLDYDPCSGYLYASSNGRSIYKTLVPFNTETYTLSAYSNITWAIPRYLDSDLVIPNDATLNITSTLYMAEGKKIIVEPRGKLIIDGGKITTRCNNSWQGIEVWGNSSQTQYPDNYGKYKQGYLELKNGAIIENAICAVNLWKPGDWSKTGGIVKATNATFRNNTNSIHALNYRNFNPNYPAYETDNLCSFNNCIFELNENYLGSTTFYKHIDLSRVKGISFNSCDFSLNNNAIGVSAWNQAIASYSAGFKVVSNIGEYSQFNGFWRAISADNPSLKPYTFSVNRAEFLNNGTGINIANVNNISVLNSTFQIGNSAYTAENCYYGIRLEASTGFAIEENHFSKSSAAPTANHIGISVINSGGVDDIYRNTFTGLSAANYAFGKNYELNTQEGLTYICNDNTGNYADVYVYGEEFTDAIQSFQGNLTSPAGNSFSSSATWNFYNGTKNMLSYYYCQSCNIEYPELVEFVARNTVNNTNACLPHYGSALNTVILNTTEKQACETAFAQATVQYNNVKTLYNNLKDGGSTAAELYDITTAQPDDMWALRTKLLGDSPHLSAEVLKEVADKTDVFAEAAIFDILAANPDELRSKVLLEYLAQKDNPLPQYMIDILSQVAEGTTYKTVLQMQLAQYSHIKARAANDMLRSILNEDILDQSQLRDWLDNLGGLSADRQIIASYMHEGNYENAFALANMLPELYPLSGEEDNEHNHFMQLLQLQQDLTNSNRGCDSLSVDELQMLDSISLIDQGSSGSIARSILELQGGQPFANCPSLDGDASFKSQAVDIEKLSKAKGMSLTAKPNPANSWIAFDYTLPDGATEGRIEITNASGAVVDQLMLHGNQGQKLFDSRRLSSGAYTGTVIAGSYIQSIAFVVQH